MVPLELPELSPAFVLRPAARPCVCSRRSSRMIADVSGFPSSFILLSLFDQVLVEHVEMPYSWGFTEAFSALVIVASPLI